MNYIKTKMEKRGIKPTYQRLSILEYLEKNKNHPTADMIYEYLAKRIPTISKTTVYNTVNLFLESGLIHTVTITGTKIRYDINSQNHHHFLCKKCGKIIDIDVECPFAKGRVEEIYGNKIEEIHGYFKGVCKECRNRVDE